PEDSGGPAASPGRQAVHYAPRTRSVRVEPEHLGEMTARDDASLLVFVPHDLGDVPASVYRYDCPEPDLAAVALYALLHACDDLTLDLIVVILPPDRPEWRALRDRLARATRPWTAGLLD